MAGNLASLPAKTHYCDRCLAMSTVDGLKALLSEDGYPLRSRQKLNDSASGGCVFCKNLTAMSSIWDSYPISLRMRLEWGDGSVTKNAQTFEELIGTNKIQCLEVTFQQCIYGRLTSYVQDLHAFAKEDDPCKPFVSRLFSFEGISSDKTLCRLRSSFEECEIRHLDCRNLYNPKFPDRTKHLLPPLLPTLPTRVLDTTRVEGRSEVQLYITKKNEHGRYVALSYCWGGPQHLTTTMRTLPKRVKGIPKSSLPQTIRDAIEVTQKLGFRFLWIDSLCIVQDSPDDKRRELAIMGEVYKNATITIAAGNAKAVEEGFLSERPLFNGFPLPFRVSGQSLGSVYFRRSPQPLPSDPVLFSRGWAFQEFLLSPRVILYDGFGVTWNCNATSFKGLSDVISYKPSHKLSFSRSIQHLRLNIAMSAKYTNSGWSSLVSEYSERDFTCFEDRLPAIAGIAKVFSALLNDEYVAGLWRKELIWTIGWQKQERLFSPAIRPFQHLRQERIGSPSWSWKTAPFPISVSWWRGAFYTLSAEVISYKATLSSEDSPFGDVVEGILTLRAKVRPVSASFRDGIRLDYSTDNMDISVYVLLLGIWNKEGDPEGLVVRKLGDGSFERIGFFRDRSGKPGSWDSVISEVVILR